MAGKNAGRRGGRYRKLHAALKARRLPCWLCGQPIRYDLDWPDPRSFSYDHAHPLSTHPHMAEDPSNGRPSHLGCNTSRQADRPTPPLGDPGHDW